MFQSSEWIFESPLIDRFLFFFLQMAIELHELNLGTGFVLTNVNDQSVNSLNGARELMLRFHFFAVDVWVFVFETRGASVAKPQLKCRINTLVNNGDETYNVKRVLKKRWNSGTDLPNISRVSSSKNRLEHAKVEELKNKIKKKRIEPWSFWNNFN